MPKLRKHQGKLPAEIFQHGDEIVKLRLPKRISRHKSLELPQMPENVKRWLDELKLLEMERIDGKINKPNYEYHKKRIIESLKSFLDLVSTEKKKPGKQKP